MQGGQGRFRFLPLGPPAPPVTPLKRSLREGYGTVRRVCTAPKGATVKRRSRRRSRLRGNNSRHLASPSRSPFGHSLRSCPLSPHAGTAFGWCYRQPALSRQVDASKASRRRGCSVAALVYVNPSVNSPCGDSSPFGEPLGGIHKLLYNLGGPPMTAPTPHLINLWQKQGDAQRPPYLHNLLR